MTDEVPASIMRTEHAEFSVSRLATTLPAVPARKLRVKTEPWESNTELTSDDNKIISCIQCAIRVFKYSGIRELDVAK